MSAKKKTDPVSKGTKKSGVSARVVIPELALDGAKIKRIIAHKVFKRNAKGEVGVEYESEVFGMDASVLEQFTKRLTRAFDKHRRSFRLEISNHSPSSFFHIAKSMKNCKDYEFVQFSKDIADLLATSHSKRTIPEGILIVIDGTTGHGEHLCIVVKAELQDAFGVGTDKGKRILELVGNLFLSPAKDFYKIGLIHENRGVSSLVPNEEYSCYMYDDQFTPAKDDLSAYFYSDFLGFTTDSNDKLRTKNFHSLVTLYLDNSFPNFEENKEMKIVLRNELQQGGSLLEPLKYMTNNLPTSHHPTFRDKVVSKFERPFMKDTTLLEPQFKRSSVPLTGSMKITGPTKMLEENLEILTPGPLTLAKLKEEKNIMKIVIVKTRSEVNTKEA